MVCVAVAVAVWVIFLPGLFSPDSMAQYSQALSGRYNDWHPPAMAVLVSAVLACGADVGLVTLVQAVSACLGMFELALACLRFLIGRERSPTAARWLALAVFALLFWPLTPFAFYMVTLWKDSWAVILFLWIGALGLNTFGDVGRISRARFGVRCGVWLLLVTLAALVRHNMVLALPACSAAFYVLLRARGVRYAAAGLAVPALLYLAVDAAIYRVFDVERRHPGDQVMALELVGLCVTDPALRGRLPHTSRHLVEETYKGRYRVGYVGPIISDTPPIVRPGYARGNHGPLAPEYRYAATHFPVALARLKLRAFGQLVNLHQMAYYHQTDIFPNRFGLAHRPRLRAAREWMIDGAKAVIRARLRRWFTCAQAIWMAMNAVWLGAAVEFWLRRRDRRFLFAAALLLVPLSYSLSYALAVTSFDYRFLYPSTAAVQVVSVPCLAWWVWGWAARIRRLRRAAGP